MTVLCLDARRRPGRWTLAVAEAIGLALAAVAVSYTVGLVLAGTWSARTSLPLALCDMGVVVAAVACWWRVAVLVEITYFWGLAGTLQGVLTPDLDVGFPHLVFFQYVVGHLGIVVAALFLVVGMRIEPRPGAVPRVFSITAAYTALVGLVDARHRFELHVPPPTARRVDPAPPSRPVALVRGDRRSRRAGALHAARRALLARSPTGRDAPRGRTSRRSTARRTR